MLRDASITEKKLADGAVTGGKIADATIEGKKLVQGAVGSRELGAGAVESDAIRLEAVTGEKLAPGSVSNEKLMNGAVSKEKLAAGLLTTTISGRAEDGEAVGIPGEWVGTPAICVTGFSMPSYPSGALLAVQAANLRREGETWCFDAVARATVPADEVSGTDEVTVGGTIFWMVIGRQ